MSLSPVACSIKMSCRLLNQNVMSLAQSKCPSIKHHHTDYPQSTTNKLFSLFASRFRLCFTLALLAPRFHLASLLAFLSSRFSLLPRSSPSSLFYTSVTRSFFSPYSISPTWIPLLT
jgi:hypothetical protein